MTMRMATMKQEIIKNVVGLTGRSNQPNTDRVPFVVSNSAVPRAVTVEGNWERMDAKIMVEMPLPMPCSVMSSPSHIRSMEPAVMDVTERIQSDVVGSNDTVLLAATD